MELYKVVHQMMKDAKIDYKLRAQIEDSTQSVSSNIAEGYSRRSIKEYLQHLYISLGSLSETLSRIVAFRAAEQATSEQFEQVDVLHYEVENKLWNLVKSLEKKKDDGTWIDRVSESSEEFDVHPQPNNPPIQ